MTDPNPVDSDTTRNQPALARWRDIFSELHDENAESKVLSGQLAAWCERFEVAEAALYSCRYGANRLVAMFGQDDYPVHLHDCGTKYPKMKRIGLDGGWVLMITGGLPDSAAVSQELILLILAATIADLKRHQHSEALTSMAKGVESVALFEVGLALASILDLEDVGEEIVSRAIMISNCSVGALYLLEGNEFVLTTVSEEVPERLDAGKIDVRELRKGRSGLDAELFPGVDNALAVPIDNAGTLEGLLVTGTLLSEENTGLVYSDSNLPTLKLFANQAAIAINTARLHRAALEQERVEQDLRVAKRIQRRLLPESMPQIPGFEVEGWNRPARTVGGDYYTIRQVANHRWALAVGDVAGKGISAALMVSTLDSALRMLLKQSTDSLDIVRSVDEHILEASEDDKFITMTLGILDPERMTLSHVNAGHNSTIVVAKSGEARYLGSGGPPVGMLPGSDFAQEDVHMKPGDLICFYSDGITECMSNDEEEFGDERLVNLLKDVSDVSLNDIIERIDLAISNFAGGPEQGDDQTVVLLRRKA